MAPPSATMTATTTATATTLTSAASNPVVAVKSPDETSPLKQTPLDIISHGPIKLQGPPKTFPHLSAHRQWLLSHLAGAFRHWAREGYVEGLSGHMSVRDPEQPNAFWTNPLGVHFGLLRASDMILVDLDGRVVGGNTRRPPNSAGFPIHAAVHRARADVHAVCHAHSTHGKAWSVFGRRLEMLTQDACKFFADAQAVYDGYGGVVLGSDEGDNIARALGPAGKGCILRNHGLLTVGSTVDEAAWLFRSLERSCHVQLLAEAAAANGVQKRFIDDRFARINFDAEADPDVCYCEFQVYYDFEERMAGDEFKA